MVKYNLLKLTKLPQKEGYLMYSLSENNNNENTILKSISTFYKEYGVGKALKKANVYKAKGFPVMEVFMYVLQLVFTKKSMYMNLKNGTHNANFAKDAVYRFFKSPFINWNVFILTVALNLISKLKTLTSESRISAIVVDDTFFGRERSKKVELLANIHDHASKGTKYKKGFRLLTLGWTDGVSFIPLLFRHLSSTNKINRYNEINTDIDKRSCGYKSRLQAISTGPKVLLDFLEMLAKTALPAKHVLFDSWFSYPAMLISISKLKLSTVARLKNTPKIKYLLGEEKKTLNELYNSKNKRRGKSKYLLSIPVKLYNSEDETLDARIVFVRDRNNKKKWIAFISTDLSLSEEQVIELYGKRWSIEVFFKICKSYLNLGSEFKQLSYDAITAHTAVVMIRYMILSIEKRQNEDPRALGELFFSFYDEVAGIQFYEAFELILTLLKNVLEDALFLTETQIESLIENFISKLPSYFQSINRLKSA